MTQPTDLYRHYDDRGELLYVGISTCAMRRKKSHDALSEWTHFASSMTGQKFPTRASAEAAERKVIQAEQPLFNIVHSSFSPTERANRIRAYKESRGIALTDALCDTSGSDRENKTEGVSAGDWYKPLFGRSGITLQTIKFSSLVLLTPSVIVLQFISRELGMVMGIVSVILIGWMCVFGLFRWLTNSSRERVE